MAAHIDLGPNGSIDWSGETVSIQSVSGRFRPHEPMTWSITLHDLQRTYQTWLGATATMSAQVSAVPYWRHDGCDEVHLVDETPGDLSADWKSMSSEFGPAHAEGTFHLPTEVPTVHVGILIVAWVMEEVYLEPMQIQIEQGFEVSGHLGFSGTDGSTLPLQDVGVSLYDSDATIDERLQGPMQSDERGHYQFIDVRPTGVEDPDLYIKVQLETPYAVVQDTEGEIFSWWGSRNRETVDSNVSSNRIYNGLLGDESAESMVNGAALRLDWIRQADRWVRDQLPAELESEYLNRRRAVQVTFDPTQAGTAYHVPDGIHLFADDFLETTHHEYAHEVMYRATGGWSQEIVYPDYDGDGAGEHVIFTQSTPATAWVEGWAEFFAAAIAGNPSYYLEGVVGIGTNYWDQHFGSRVERNSWWTGHDDLRNLPREFFRERNVNPDQSLGTTVEGAVAAILWDLHDGGPNDDDQISGQFPLVYKTVLQDAPRVIWDGSGSDFYSLFKRRIPEAMHRALDEIFIDHGIPVTDDAANNHSRPTASSWQDLSQPLTNRILAYVQAPQSTSYQGTFQEQGSDWYKISLAGTPANGSQIRLRADDRGHIDIALYDNLGNLRLRRQGVASGEGRILHLRQDGDGFPDIRQGGEYFIRVFSDRNDMHPNYSLEAQLTIDEHFDPSQGGTDSRRSGLITGADAGGGPHVRVFDPLTMREQFSFYAYHPNFGGGVRVASGDVDGDGIADIITAAGYHGGPHIRVFNGRTGQQLTSQIGSFYAFHPAFTGGVNVACADVNGDGYDDIIAAAGPGGGPHVRVFSGANGAEIMGFYAYHHLFSGGVQIAAADVNGDGRADLVTGAGAGGGPHVRVFSGSDGAEILGFYAYHPLFSGGVYVASGDTNGDGHADIVTGAGAGGGPHVRVFSGADGAELTGMYAFAPDFGGGVRVAVVDAQGDQRAEIATAQGPGGGGQTRIFDVASRSEIDSFLAYPGFGGGAFVGSSTVHVAAAHALRLASRDTASQFMGELLVEEQLERLREAAIARWQHAGLHGAALEGLEHTKVRLANLPGNLLGLAGRDQILVDLTAAGSGWFIDPTPADDREFASFVDGAWAAAFGSAGEGVDLLTVLVHELGHVLGLEDLASTANHDDVMAAELGRNVRRLLSAEHVDAAMALAQF